MKANEIRPGVALNIDGKLYVVAKIGHVKPGKGPAYIQAKMRAVDGSGMKEQRFSGSDVVDGTTLDRREMEFLYGDGEGGGTFMDMQDYDQVELGKDLLDDALLYMAANSTCTVMFHESTPVAVELPSSVTVTITDTAPGIKGATATNQLKEAECDTGLKTRVPPFIAIGEKVRVSTEDGSYMARVKED
ncbi:MAG: elongation factor P [Phycisphaerales bacterium]|nr:elongation factor P [Phycisphaerales bacterium]